MNPRPLATPYRMEAPFFEEAELWELPLDFVDDLEEVLTELEELEPLDAEELVEEAEPPLLPVVLFPAPLFWEVPTLEDVLPPLADADLLVFTPLDAALVLDVEVDAVPALACVVPDFRRYDGIFTVFRAVVRIFCAVSVTSLA